VIAGDNPQHDARRNILFTVNIDPARRKMYNETSFCPHSGRINLKEGIFMAFKKIATGLQHIGLPTNDMEKTLAFYTGLGFEIAYQTILNGEPVVFLKLGDLVIETYENKKAAGVWGAIDHVAINVTDVAEARRIADDMGLKVIEEGKLPFWANGVQYFTVEGPNNEKVEFNQYL